MQEKLFRKVEFYSKINHKIIKNNLSFFKGFSLPNSKKPSFTKREIKEFWRKHLKARAKSKIKDSLSLYIHIPFCIKRCNFCCYQSGVFNEGDAEKYIQSIKRDCEYFKKSFLKIKFDSVYFGGGTPNIFNDRQLNDLISFIFRTFKIKKGADIAFESNPIFVNKEKIITLKKLGINRVSFGIQSFDKMVLSFINRSYQNENAIEKAIEISREAGIENINVDLVLGLKGDNDKKFLKSVSKALALKPNSLTIYKLMPTKDYLDILFPSLIKDSVSIQNLFKKNYNLPDLFKKIEKIVKSNNYIFWGENDRDFSKPCLVFFKDHDSMNKTNPINSYSFSKGGINSCLGLGLYSQSHIFGKIFYKDMNQEFNFDANKKNYIGNTIIFDGEILFDMAEQLESIGCVDIEKINLNYGIDFINHFKEAISDLTALRSIEIKDGKLCFIEKRIKVAESLLFFLKPSLLRTFLSVYLLNRF